MPSKYTSRIMSFIEKTEYPSELKCLDEWKSVPRDGKLFPLNVFLGTNDIILVVGRLLNQSNLTYNQKLPMLLPRNHEFTNKIIMHYHKTNFHAGAQLTLSLIWQKFWLIDWRSLVCKQLRKDVKGKFKRCASGVFPLHELYKLEIMMFRYSEIRICWFLLY